MKRDDIEHLIDELFSHINGHDIDRCVACYSDDAELQDPTFPDTVRGAEHVRQGFASWLAAFPDVRAWVVTRIIDQEKAAVEWAFEGTHAAEYLGVLPSRRVFKTLTVSHFTFRDGKIVRDFSLFDATALRKLEALRSRGSSAISPANLQPP
jgi:steroid delta-isomerase-like uncharacterized protein